MRLVTKSCQSSGSVSRCRANSGSDRDIAGMGSRGWAQADYQSSSIALSSSSGRVISSAASGASVGSSGAGATPSSPAMKADVFCGYKTLSHRSGGPMLGIDSVSNLSSVSLLLERPEPPIVLVLAVVVDNPGSINTRFIACKRTSVSGEQVNWSDPGWVFI